jgi:hypothetical protein
MTDGGNRYFITRFLIPYLSIRTSQDTKKAADCSAAFDLKVKLFLQLDEINPSIFLPLGITASLL